ncbi:MAG TPA: hypothetical protein VHL54_10620 [Actinomycetota bacterium]|nr:hypothetical protein [Actinomycetota bacterium]
MATKRRLTIPEQNQPENRTDTSLDSSEVDSVKVTPIGSPRQRQGRWPTSPYLPGFTSKVASRTCPKCGFEAFAYAERCRCGTPFTD